MNTAVKIPAAPILIKKHCNNCNKIHSSVPGNARPWVDDGQFLGWMWECDGWVQTRSKIMPFGTSPCNSTMFQKAK